jgi:hypothetical protein
MTTDWTPRPAPPEERLASRRWLVPTLELIIPLGLLALLAK